MAVVNLQRVVEAVIEPGEGDTYSLAGCNDVGVRRLAEMMDEFGITSLDRLAGFIVDRSRATVLAEIARLPQGSWSYEMQVDGYDAPILLRGTLTVSASGMHMDYGGSAGLQRKGINVPLTYATAYTVYGMGCVLNAPKPAPVSARSVLGTMLPDMVCGCLRQAAPGLVPAEGANCLWNIPLRGARRDGTLFANSVSTTGGTGARPGQDGLSCTGVPSGIQGTPVEIAETQSPVIFWRKEFRPGSGGARQARGGLGQIIEIESAEDLPFALVSSFDRVLFPARGQAGGMDGARGHVGLASGQIFPGKGRHEIPAGERLVLLTPGGAGLGPPSERDPGAVARDVDDGLMVD